MHVNDEHLQHIFGLGMHVLLAKAASSEVPAPYKQVFAGHVIVESDDPRAGTTIRLDPGGFPSRVIVGFLRIDQHNVIRGTTAYGVWKLTDQPLPEQLQVVIERSLETMKHWFPDSEFGRYHDVAGQQTA